MPNHSIPGVEIITEDLSQVIKINNSIQIGMVGQFERGPEKPILISDDVLFNKYFGSIDYKALAGKAGVNPVSYISAVMALKKSVIYVANCVNSTAKYGNLLLTRIGCVENNTGLSDNEVYDFTQNIRLIENEIIGEGDGAETDFTLQLATLKKIEPGTVIIKFTIGTTEYSITDNGKGGWIDTDNKIDEVNSSINYEDKEIIISFNTAPDDNTNIIADYQTIFVNDSIVENEIIGEGDGVATTLTGTIGTLCGIVPGSVTIKFTIGTTEYSITDNGAGKFNDPGNKIAEATSWIKYNDRTFSIVFDTAPDDNTNITVDYELYDNVILGIFIAFSKKAWINNFALKVVDYDSETNSFTIEEYQKINNSNIKLLTSYEVSRDPAYKNGMGKNRYIQSVINTESYFFEYIDNTNILYSTNIFDNTSIVYAMGGDDGITPTSNDIVNSISNFNEENINFNVFISAGYTEQTIVNSIISLLNSKGKFGFFDTPAGETVANIKIFADAQPDNNKLAYYSPWTYETYSGREFYCPSSAVVAMKYAMRVKSGQPYMPPAGIGENNGSIESVRLDKYYNETEIGLLNKSNVNVIKYTHDNGNVIFNDLTMQKTISSTSYINSSLTLLKMQELFKTALEFINFKIINTQTFLQLRSLIESTLNQLQLFDGTIEPNQWTVKIEELNNAQTKDDKKIVAQIIFVFQSLAEKIVLQLTYTSNQLYSEII
ncbi:MAG: hypothetical protein ACM31H_01020 [Nitrososphaerales archaeon]